MEASLKRAQRLLKQNIVHDLKNVGFGEYGNENMYHNMNGII